jgi:site-specific DNA-cytosine methylase
MEYKENPTKEDLYEYFKDRLAVRKMTEIEALRVMDVDNADIEKMRNAGIAKTNLYKMAGNSIVVNCLFHIFRTMFIDTDELQPTVNQLTLSWT